MRFLHECVTFGLLFLIMASFGCKNVSSQSDSLGLEWEQHWDTYGVGGTCCYGTDNFFVGDIDNDGIEELITGGFSYLTENGTRVSIEAPLKIWNWNGRNLTCESSISWIGSIRTLFASDIDNDGLIEIITGGVSVADSDRIPQINVWRYDGAKSSRKGSYDGISASSICVAELKANQNPLVLIVGGTTQENRSYAQLTVFQWTENELSLLDSEKWCSSNEAHAYSVFAQDLNNDGQPEIITGGYDNDLTNSSGQVRIWSWADNHLVLETCKEWQMVTNVFGVTISGLPMGNTMINNVKAADVDSDGVSEVISGGFTYDGQVFNAQLRIWNWTGSDLILEKSQEWISEDITEVKSISLNDVDKDNEIEIITSGLTSVYGSFNNTECTPDYAQLRVWNWKDNSLTLEISKDWTVGDGVVAWNLVTSDLDNDNTVEIVTVGCMGVSGQCDPDLRIWSISTKQNTVGLPLELLIVAVAIIGIFGILIYVIRRK